MDDWPRPLLWSDRASAMPYIRGGQEQQVDALREFLLAVRAHGIDPRVRHGEEAYRTKGMVERTSRDRWTVTPLGERWLDTRDPELLIAVLHSQYRYVGELLGELTSSRLTHQNLLQIARSEYGLDWNSLDQVRRRTGWLRSVGFVELRFDTGLVITDAGRRLVERLENHPPTSEPATSSTRDAVHLKPAGPILTSILNAMRSGGSVDRRRTWGYVPSDQGIPGVARVVLDLAGSKVTRGEWLERAAERWQLSESSAASTLGFPRAAGLLEPVDFEVFAPTPVGAEWRDSGSDIDLVRLMHTRFLFIGELLDALQTTGSVSDLAATAQTYNLSPAETQRRLALFRQCGLVEEVGTRRYRLTPLGEALLRELPGTPPSPVTLLEQQVVDDRKPISHAAGASAIRDELALAARAASDHQRLERAVATAFRAMGFDEQHLGGPGRTDVVAVSPLAGDSRFTVIADAKASGRGDVGAFDPITLREHMEKHGADIAVAIGEKFGDGRTVKRAVEQRIGLLTTSNLALLVELCADGAIGVADVRLLLSHAGEISTDSIMARARPGQRLFALAQAITFVVADESAANDEETSGAVSVQDVYRQLRGRDEAPTKQEIQVVLDLLSGPFVRGLIQHGDQYSLGDHITMIASRLRQIGTLLSEIDPLQE